jgi:hypothetical protein
VTSLSEALGALGFRGDLPAAPPAPAAALPRVESELWGFRAGLKPVAFLKVAPERAAAVLATFGPLHLERRDRGAWVELYLSHDPASARRAMELQSADPSAHLRELGALLGYPRCCVEAFAAQPHRGDDAQNRRATFARTPPGGEPWPWPLDNLVVMPVPFFPCTYRCEPALAWARTALAAGGAADGLRPFLARPVLFLGEGQAVLLGARVETPPGAPPVVAALAGALALGDDWRLEEDALRVRRHGREVFALARLDPARSFLASFG